MIAIVDGCGSNVASIEHALIRLKRSYVLTKDPKVLQAAAGVIIPGVATAKRALNAISSAKLVTVMQNLKVPVLGICSGMQLLFEWCVEDDIAGLGIFPGSVNKLKVARKVLPHMGWNTLSKVKPRSILLEGIALNDYVYFVHSFAADLGKYTVASCEYEVKFSAIVQKDNFWGTQFHPEKSGKVGLKILENFLKING